MWDNTIHFPTLFCFTRASKCFCIFVSDERNSVVWARLSCWSNNFKGLCMLVAAATDINFRRYMQIMLYESANLFMQFFMQHQLEKVFPTTATLVKSVQVIVLALLIHFSQNPYLRSLEFGNQEYPGNGYSRLMQQTRMQICRLSGERLSVNNSRVASNEPTWNSW